MNIWRENRSITTASLWSSSLYIEAYRVGGLAFDSQITKGFKTTENRAKKGTAYGSDDHTEKAVPFPAEAVKSSFNKVVSKISACVLNTLTLEFVGDP